MRVNRDASTYKPPFRVVEFDATDAYYFADIMDNISIFDTIESFDTARAVADALFIVRNYRWPSFEDMVENDGGFNERLIDANTECVYVAHETFANTWIGAV